MTSTPISNDHILARRAIEALRNGVPSASAVTALGSMQPEAEERFLHQLDQLGESNASDLSFVPGLLISGEFGTGKSHTLAWMEQAALEQNFIVSKVVLSKETPLHAPAKVFQAAVREARLPQGNGSLIHELATQIDYRSKEAEPFLNWAIYQQPHGIIAATVRIHEVAGDPEMAEAIEDYWSGEKIKVSTVKNALKLIGQTQAFDIKPLRIAELAPIRFEFGARFARACGYKGWVMLLDEAELIARYTLLQRGKAYAELARWLRPTDGNGIQGITAVAAITRDFAFEMFANKNDQEDVPDRLSRKGDVQGQILAEHAISGIDIINNDSTAIKPPDGEMLSTIHSRIRDLYRDAHDWDAPLSELKNVVLAKSMRSHIRRWITEWDLARFYPDIKIINIKEGSISANYEEDSELSSGADDEDV